MSSKLAVISDVHGDVRALEDALAQIARLGCELVVCAGDLVDWGRFPEETISLLRERSIPCVQGNHDRWAVVARHDTNGLKLTDDALRFLERLPAQWRTELDGVRIVVTHARPGSDMNGVYPEATAEELEALVDAGAADVLIVGHTHLPMTLELRSGAVVANPGALLRAPAQPMENGVMLYDPVEQQFVPAQKPGGGTFGIVDASSKRFTLHRASDGADVEIASRSL